MRDVSKDVCVPSHLEPKVKLYNDRAYQGGGVFLCVFSMHSKGGCRKPACPWIHPQTEEAWVEVLKGL